MSQSKDTIAILSAVKSRADRLLCRRYFPLGKHDFYLGLSDHDVIVTRHFGWVKHRRQQFITWYSAIQSNDGLSTDKHYYFNTHVSYPPTVGHKDVTVGIITRLDGRHLRTGCTIRLPGRDNVYSSLYSSLYCDLADPECIDKTIKLYKKYLLKPYRTGQQYELFGPREANLHRKLA